MDLEKCMLDIDIDCEMPQWSSKTVDAGHPSRMPNPDRTLADGDPMYTSFIDILGTMSLIIGQKTGISTGILILLTKICHGSFSTNRLPYILYQPQCMQVFQNNFRESRKSSSELYLICKLWDLWLKVEEHIACRSKSEMHLMGSRWDSEFTATVLWEITLLRVRLQATLKEMETIPVASVSSVEHRKYGRLTMDFMHPFLYVLWTSSHILLITLL